LFGATEATKSVLKEWRIISNYDCCCENSKDALTSSEERKGTGTHYTVQELRCCLFKRSAAVKLEVLTEEDFEKYSLL
jgi:hypothetical protein